LTQLQPHDETVLVRHFVEDSLEVDTVPVQLVKEEVEVVILIRSLEDEPI
jgi:hypothetical protein